MNGPNSIAKRVAAAGAAGWVAAGLGAGVAAAVGAGRSATGDAASGPTPSTGAGGSGIKSAGGTVTGREAAGVGVEGGASSRCRKIAFGRSLLPNQPRRHPARPPSAARSASTIAPIQRRFDFDATNVGMSNGLGSADGSTVSLAEPQLATAL